MLLIYPRLQISRINEAVAVQILLPSKNRWPKGQPTPYQKQTFSLNLMEIDVWWRSQTVMFIRDAGRTQAHKHSLGILVYICPLCGKLAIHLFL